MWNFYTQLCYALVLHRDPVGAKWCVNEFMDSCRDGWMDIRMRTRDDREIETMWANIRLSDQTQVGIGIDITDRKRDEAQRELLVAELSHRVKNTLATVISIAHRVTVAIHPSVCHRDRPQSLMVKVLFKQCKINGRSFRNLPSCLKTTDVSIAERRS